MWTQVPDVSTPSELVRVMHRGREHRLARGESLTFGRGADCTIRLPNDGHISRMAGSIAALEDCALIRNHSESKPFVLRPPTGEDLVIEPGAASTSLPHQQLQVVIAGMAGTTEQLRVDLTGLAAPPKPVPAGTSEPTSTAIGDLVTVTAPFPLTRSQQRVVEALCEPMLSRHGAAAAPATYQQIGEALGLSPQYVRNVIQTVRETLSGHGVPDLVSDDPTRPGGDFRWSLARYAIRNRWVAHDLNGLGDR